LVYVKITRLQGMDQIATLLGIDVLGAFCFLSVFMPATAASLHDQ